MVVEKAFKGLYPKKEFKYFGKVRYSGKFNDYNGNIMLRGINLTLSMSRSWKDVDDDIKIGLVQVLLNKLFKTNIKTLNMDLYNHFLKKVHLSVPKTESDPLLEESFNRVNEKYLHGVIERPNLTWGSASMSKLGSYEYGKDMIVISSVFKDAPEEFLDLVMYHEVLHKKHKFNSSGKRSFYHTTDFKKDEKRFYDFINAERRLTSFLRKKRFKRSFWF